MKKILYNKKDIFNNSANSSSVKEQLSLFVAPQKAYKSESTFEKLVRLLQSNLNFHNQGSHYSSHNFHSFPAKFPPQLPKLFIEELTNPNEVVLDPMVGSGTTLVEASLANRKGIGFDIDPLAIKIARTKTTHLNKRELLKYGSEIYTNAKFDFINNKEKLFELLQNYFNPRTKEFVDYWFLPETQLELISLLNQINRINKDEYRDFFEVVFSSIIITKSGGVSLALDLGHTRPHRIKATLDNDGNVVFGDKNFDVSKKRFLTKNIRPSIEEFRKRFDQNVKSSFQRAIGHKPEIIFCDAQKLCLENDTIDLIITSPPYASNAIDYMRAHKFSLVWFGYKIEELTKRRSEYIGSESVANYLFEDLPEFTFHKIMDISMVNFARGRTLKRYFSEMKKTLKEMYRVLKPEKTAIVIVGNSIMKGVDTETHKCLKEIGESIGFIVPYIGIRKLDRNRRMLPASKKIDLTSQIQKRMYEEYVIGFYKP